MSGSKKEKYTSYGGTIAFSASAMIALGHLYDMRDRAQLIVEREDIDEYTKRINYVADFLSNEEVKKLRQNKEHLLEYENKISEYSNLVDENASEPIFQKFFKNNPVFLNPTVEESYPKANFVGKGYPDFLLGLTNGDYLLVEIETPIKRIFTKVKKYESSDFRQARKQISDYVHLAIAARDWLKRDFPNISVENTRGLLVIGKKTDLDKTDQENLRNMNYDVRGTYQIKTFDDILDENIRTLKNLRRTR